jgi:chromosome segregation ATPase
MSTAIEKFEELETRIVRTVELVKSTQKELAAARTQISRMERELDELRRERDVVKDRIEALLVNLSEVTEEPRVQTEAAISRR